MCTRITSKAGAQSLHTSKEAQLKNEFLTNCVSVDILLTYLLTARQFDPFDLLTGK